MFESLLNCILFFESARRSTHTFVSEADGVPKPQGQVLHYSKNEMILINIIFTRQPRYNN